jgi:hypothetical protein
MTAVAASMAGKLNIPIEIMFKNIQRKTKPYLKSKKPKK